MSDASGSRESAAAIMAGVPLLNSALYHRLRFSVVDTVVYLRVPTPDGRGRSIAICRDIEMQRARKHAAVDEVACPKDFTPQGGLSGDRETATAQAAAECLRRAGATRVVGDRTLPLIFADLIRQAGIAIECDREMGVLERRTKDAQEIAWLREAQAMTEAVMEFACRLIAKAAARADGVLMHDGAPLTAERVRAAIDHWLIDRGYANPPAIVAGGPPTADCHWLGYGELRTGQPVVVDIFPRNRDTLYNGDCTRTVVHGDIPDEVARMHAAVCRAKAAATAAIRAGVTGEAVYLATAEAIRGAGYPMGLPPAGSPDSYCAMTHGVGHGVGLDVHEPPLLDISGPELLPGDVVTVEPGLYRADLGGVRVEDLLVVTQSGSENLNRLPEGLRWE
jgi:Xaa-Pro aminopeptidase